MMFLIPCVERHPLTGEPCILAALERFLDTLRPPQFEAAHLFQSCARENQGHLEQIPVHQQLQLALLQLHQALGNV